MNLLVNTKKQLNQKKIKKKEIRNVTAEILEIIFSGRECEENYYYYCFEIICEERNIKKSLQSGEKYIKILVILIFLFPDFKLIRFRTLIA